MTDPQNLPELEPQASDESSIETRSKHQEKSITRNVEWFVNDFLPWSLGGLGGVGVIGFIAHSQILAAIVTFLVTVVVVSWAKYTRSFTRTFSTIAGKRGDQDAKSLAQWIGNGGQNIAEVLRWYCSGFTKKYLKDQAVDCRDLDTEGLSPTDLRIPMLREVFVPLRLSGPVGRAIDEHDLTERELKRLRNAERDEVLEIWDLLRRSKKEPYYRQIAVQARGGYGKTTLLQHIALIYGLGEYRGWKFWTPKFRTPKRVPFLLRLRDYRKEMEAATIAPLPKLIHEHHLKDLIEQGITPPTPHWAEILLQRGDALVMFDGFDEVPMELREKVSHWITKQMQTYDNATFILTSRPVAYQEHYAAKRPSTPIMVQSFTLKQQQEFVEKWYRCQERTYRKGDRKVVQLKADKNARNFWTQLQARPELTDLAGIPLLLNLLVTYHRSSVRPELPRQRLDLYRGICKLQLEDRPVARNIAIRVPYDRSMDILRLLAWKMTNQPKPLYMLSRSQILNFLSSQTVLQKENVTPEAFLKMVVEVAELLVEKEAGEYEFPHLSFQGFFAAEELIKVENSQEVALNKWLQAKESPIWQEILPFFTAQLPAQDFQLIIRESLKLGIDAVQTSAKCLKEYRNQDSQLQQEINALGGILSNSRYAKLEQLLKAGEWEKADRETDRVMLEVKEKDLGDYLTFEDIEKFPCEDLLMIDNLWVTASNGHFGFSVQKKIWEKYGSPMSHNDDYQKFMETVGWRSGGNFVSYSEIKFSQILSPAGELPYLIMWNIGERMYSFLAQRFVNCSPPAFQPENKNKL